MRINTKWKLTPPRPAISIEDARSRLTRELWLRQLNPPYDLGEIERHSWVRTQRSAISRQSIPDWTPAAVTVEGVVHVAEVYAQGEDWVATVETDRALIEIQSHQVPIDQLNLGLITDLTDYTGA